MEQHGHIYAGVDKVLRNYRISEFQKFTQITVEVSSPTMYSSTSKTLLLCTQALKSKK